MPRDHTLHVDPYGNVMTRRVYVTIEFHDLDRDQLGDLFQFATHFHPGVSITVMPGQED